LWTRGQYPAAPPVFLAFLAGHAGGAETGSTRAVKAKSVSVMVRSLSGQALKCQR